MEKTYMTVAQMSEIFGVSTTLIYRLIRSGEIPAIKIGHRSYRISSEVVRGIEQSGLMDFTFPQ